MCVCARALACAHTTTFRRWVVDHLFFSARCCCCCRCCCAQQTHNAAGPTTLCAPPESRQDQRRRDVHNTDTGGRARSHELVCVCARGSAIVLASGSSSSGSGKLVGAHSSTLLRSLWLMHNGDACSARAGSPVCVSQSPHNCLCPLARCRRQRPGSWPRLKSTRAGATQQ